jgi:hypothetical protein
MWLIAVYLQGLCDLLKQNFVQMFKNSVRASKKTQLLSITETSWLMQFKEVIPIYTENHTKRIKVKMKSRWLLKQMARIVTTGL